MCLRCLRWGQGTNVLSRDRRHSCPAQYERNVGYFEWQDANPLAEEFSVEETIDRVRELEDQQNQLEQRFEATDPTAVSVFATPEIRFRIGP